MREIRDSLSTDARVDVIGEGTLDSCFSVSRLAAATVAAVGSTLADLIVQTELSSKAPNIHVDQRLASLWFSQSIHPINWALPPPWDSVAGDYPTNDGWIKLHTNLPHHRQAALSVLGVDRNRSNVAAAVLRWNADDLESRIADAGGVAAALRSRQEWQTHPQGVAVSAEPLITWSNTRKARVRFSPRSIGRPLEGLRVLDLTRVLAGPVATRTLAGFGADVLRIDPYGWDEPFVVPDITLGKRCAGLQLDQLEDRKTFERLLEGADVLVHGFRPGALDKLGYGSLERIKLSPALIDVSLDAYGWNGPWAQRRGFDSLVQMSSGIAHTGMNWAKQYKPISLPVQALDHATGYLMAAAVIRLIAKALNNEGVGNAQLSLARTAELLASYPQTAESKFEASPVKTDFSDQIELTPWGSAHRLRPPLSIEGTPMSWTLAANHLGTSKPEWSC